MEIKEIVKKHFNLVDAPAPKSFGTIKTADGELELKYEGEELAQGLEVFVVTADGDVAAPDGEHALEGGITIVTKDGKIEAIKETEAPAEEAEVVVEEVAAAEHEEEKVEEALEEEAELAEHEEEEMQEEEAESIKETVIEEVIEAVAEVVTEKMKEMEEKLKAMEEKYAAFAKSPATSKTNALKNFSKTQKSDEAPAKNQAMIDALIAKKRKK
jgi:hypothetical protein